MNTTYKPVQITRNGRPCIHMVQVAQSETEQTHSPAQNAPHQTKWYYWDFDYTKLKPVYQERIHKHLSIHLQKNMNLLTNIEDKHDIGEVEYYEEEFSKVKYHF